MLSFLWTVFIGFIAGVIAKFVTPEASMSPRASFSPQSLELSVQTFSHVLRSSFPLSATSENVNNAYRSRFAAYCFYWECPLGHCRRRRPPSL